ncbi:Thiamine biosynthesis lipoprotein ApbE precursor [compost metagenome]
MKENGFESAIIDLGGNVLAMGPKPGGHDWSIGIQAPDEKRGTHLGLIKVKDKTIVTSGIYERFFKENGVVYHHILDPDDGYPVANDLLSVTIVTQYSMDADALSTSAFSLGLEEGMRFIEARQNTDAIFITENKDIYVTSGLRGQFELTNSDYHLIE